MVTKISTAVAVALVAFLAAPTASFAASKKSESDQQSEPQRGPYTPDVKTKLHGQSRDFQGGSIYYKRSKAKKHHSHSPANS
jgi:Ni/Co efflux regulator RcnB